MKLLKFILISLWSYFWLASVLIVMMLISVTAWLITLPFDPSRRVMNKITNFYGEALMFGVPLWRLKISGKENVPKKGPFVLISNHQSMTDIMALGSMYIPFKWVSKKENFNMPFVGWSLRMNRDIMLERANPRSMVKMMNRCVDELKSGNNVMIFPEGTRSGRPKPGRFREGAFTIAKKAQCPIIPVVIQDSYKAVIRKFLFRDFAAIRISIYPPIPFDEFKDKSDKDLVKEFEEFYYSKLGLN